MAKARSFGVVIHRTSGAVRRIFNPEFDQELDLHHIDPDEFMLRLEKAEYGIGVERDAMTLDQVHAIARKLGA